MNKMDNLKSCPFCGKEVAILSSIWESQMCANCDSEDCPVCYDPAKETDCMHTVVCDAQQGGCGGSTGWAINAEEAVKMWNRRTSDDTRKAKRD